ncbi:lipopolysaccharide assembly protein LapB [Malikia sp.]|uniref:lipopolysaccharide assembly protein LapB n=1 Tax=Malikia sp. TaxID=2070706 RepID=UPI0026029DDF|nr:lipopolysaccharide assembly protein LapB [Malikia sp.]MDD2729328.1 lipopolysaccharide assembly protein LapB [Malikia sp.]
MGFDYSWLLWSLPLTFVLGWLASRYDLRQWRAERKQNPKAYFRGLNHLLNEQQDQAVDAFIEAVQNDPDTSELHFALGNLFRRRGDYERAVRVHEHLLQRGDLTQKDLMRAQHALAQDFLKAGLLDRAEAALRKLEDTEHATEALLALLAIYERSRDWEQAADAASRLEARGCGSFELRLAHYRCEQAEQLRKQGSLVEALALLETLVQRTPKSARAWISLADLRQSLGDTSGGLQALHQLAAQAPQHLPLVAHSLAQWSKLNRQGGDAERVLRGWRDQHAPSLDVTQALALLQPDGEQARQLYIEHLQREPSLVAATFWLAGEHFGQPEEEKRVRQALERACEPLKRYRCAACGFEARQYFWQCPGCQSWDSYPPLRVEEL